MGSVSFLISERRWFDVLVRRCQDLASHTLDARGAELGPYVRDLATDLPADLAVHERLATQNLLGRVLARTARLTGIDQRPDVAMAFLEWVASDIARGTWHADAQRFVERCAHALGNCVSPQRHDRISDIRTARTLSIIEDRYGDAQLTLGIVNAESGVSLCHAARLLKHQTGLGFRAHLHRARIAAARRLLHHTTLSVKEVAAAVGYGSSSQFGRHFRRLCGTTPCVFRSSRSPTTESHDQ
jgi:AraC-like DNA-binding protein